MKKSILKMVQFTSRIFGKKIFGYFILYLARAGRIDLLTFAYNTKGILNHQNDIASGESFVVKNFLKKEILKKAPILLDVGANKGDYSALLFEEFPDAKIFAFEPTLTAYKLLKKKLSETTVQIFNIGLGEERATRKIYSYDHDTGSPHSSVFKEVFTKIHGAKQVQEIDFVCTTIDDFCAEHNITTIDFLKIDTEGSELNTLKGATKMLSMDNIHFIQFEFNEMNIISRVFLKDFYDILEQYEFYRLSEKKLIPLGAYSSANEIFKFQNILAINKSLKK